MVMSGRLDRYKLRKMCHRSPTSCVIIPELREIYSRLAHSFLPDSTLKMLKAEITRIKKELKGKNEKQG